AAPSLLQLEGTRHRRPERTALAVATPAAESRDFRSLTKAGPAISPRPDGDARFRRNLQRRLPLLLQCRQHPALLQTAKPNTQMQRQARGATAAFLSYSDRYRRLRH